MPESELVDTHAHLDQPEFDSDREQAIARARDAGVTTIISAGTDLEASRRAIRLARDHSGVFATAGFHPHEAVHMKESDIAALEDLTKQPKVVALGEMGLDYFRNRSPREAQLRALQWQLNLSAKLKLPVVIHCRQAEKDMLPLLRKWTCSLEAGHPVGVIHCFSSDPETAQEYLGMGFYLSLGAYIGYPSSRNRAEVIRTIPVDRLLVETDSPFLPPQVHRGKRNEPSYVPYTVRVLSELRRTPPEKIAEDTTRNARALFRLPP